MAEFVTVGDSSEVPEGEVKAFDVNGAETRRRPLRRFAFSDIRTHRHCNLAMGGELDDHTIECECHGSMFDIRTGEVVNLPATDPIETYQAREADGQIQVGA